MNLVENITTSGKNITSSLNGRILLDEAQARLVISQEDGVEKVVHNIDGSFYNDDTGAELSRLDTDGITISDSDEHRARFGRNPQGTRVNTWISPDGTDVLELLESEG